MGSPYPKNFPYGEFRCHLCGNCCRGEGIVAMTAADIGNAADALAMTREAFTESYCVKNWDGEHHLIDQEDELKSCIFLNEDNTCRIHEGKPQQCRDFPFKWRPRDVMEFCHGMRAAAGLPPPDDRQTMSDRRRRS